MVGKHSTSRSACSMVSKRSTSHSACSMVSSHRSSHSTSYGSSSHITSSRTIHRRLLDHSMPNSLLSTSHQSHMKDNSQQVFQSLYNNKQRLNRLHNHVMDNS